MSTPAPLVSVIIAAWNGAAFLRDTIASVSAQTMSDFEIVVVDDCSTDETPALLDSIDEPRLRVIRSPVNGGPAVARTLAMANARGRFIAGLDHDDLCRPDRFARQLAYLAANPDVALVTSTIDAFGEGVPRGDPFPDLTDPGEIDWWMTMLNPLAWSSAMMRGDAARALDPFERDALRFAEDFDLYHRIRVHGRIGRIAEPLVRYRHHTAGMSRVNEDRMIRAAGSVLATRYGSLFGGRELRAGLLMSRHAGASHAPADIATLREVGETMAQLLDHFGDLAAQTATGSADALWWRIARSGLRAGHYGAPALLRVRPAFATAHAGAIGGLARAATIGAVRRFSR